MSIEHQALFGRVIDVVESQGLGCAGRRLCAMRLRRGSHPQSGEVDPRVGGVLCPSRARELPGSGFVDQGVEDRNPRVVGSSAQSGFGRRPSPWSGLPGAGDTATATFRSRYPDGSTWWDRGHRVEVRGDKIAQGRHVLRSWLRPSGLARPVSGGWLRS